MRSRIHAVVLPSEVGDFPEEIQRIFRELGRGYGESLTGQCSPSIDVYETDETLEIAMDLPGVEPGAVRILVKGQTVLIAGEKAPHRQGDSSFHLVERGYGRFARAVRLMMSCDAGRARATLAGGELRISLPKVDDRRGGVIAVSVETVSG